MKDLQLKFAKALYREAVENDRAASCFEQLEALKKLWADPEFYKTLSVFSAAPISKTQHALREAFGTHISNEVVNALALLIANTQQRLFPKVADAYRKIYFQKEGITDLKVISARALNEHEEKEIAKNLKETRAEKAHVEFAVNPELIGGLQIHEDGRLTDLSMKQYLEQVRAELMASN